MVGNGIKQQKDLNRRSLIPIVILLLLWVIYMIDTNQWTLFENNWFMSVTMIFGSFIAGASSKGVGAIAFPAMTLIFDIMPHTARNFVNWLLYIIIAVQFIGALIIIRPEGLMLLFTILVFIFGLLFFYGFTRISFLIRRSDVTD